MNVTKDVIQEIKHFFSHENEEGKRYSICLFTRSERLPFRTTLKLAQWVAIISAVGGFMLYNTVGEFIGVTTVFLGCAFAVYILVRRMLPQRKLHTILGTPYYVAPEVLQGSYDEKCDIWSIGALTYLMLCGEPPFKGKSNKEIFNKILHEQVKIDARKWNGITDEAINFVKMCLNKDPEKRPSALEALKHSWFANLLSRVHSSLFINKEILLNLKSYVPGP